MNTIPALTLSLAALWTGALPVHAADRPGPLRHDLFSRPSLSSPSAVSTASAGPVANAAADDAGPLWRPHLRAIVVAGGGSMVMLDRSVVTVGGEVEGYRLETVTEDRAVFVKGRQRVTLHLGRSGSAE